MLYAKVIGVIAVVLLAGASQAARLTEPTAKNVLHYKVAVTDSGQQSVTAAVGPLSMSKSGYNIQRGFTQIRLPDLIGSIPTTQYPSGLNSLRESAAMARASAFFRDNYPALRTGVQGWLHANGVSQAWVTYTQQIEVNVALDTVRAAKRGWWSRRIRYSSPPPKIESRTISWSAFIGMTGDGVAPAPKLLALSGVRILQLKYVSFAADPNVADERYGDPTLAIPDENSAGMLSWRTVNEAYLPLTDWTVVDTVDPIAGTGALDLPEIDDVEIDPDLMVKCLIDNSRTSPIWATETAGADVIPCDTEYPDALSLMGELGAQMAIVDYARSIEPVYCREDDAPCLAGTAEPNADLLPPGPSEPALTYIPSTAYSFDRREVSGASCVITGYRNTGSYGAKLSLVSDRFLVLATGEYQPINTTRTTRMMDPRLFDWTVAPPPELSNVALLDGYVVHPAVGGQLIPVSAVPNVQHLADIQVTGLDRPPHVNPAQFDGNRSIALALSCMPGSAGANAQVGFGYGWSDAAGELYGAPAVFTVGTAGSEVITTKLGGTGTPSTANVAYDGTNRIYFDTRFDSSAWDTFGGWTTYPDLWNNCGAGGVVAPIVGTGDGLKCSPTYLPEAGSPCAAGYSEVTGDPIPGTCHRVDPSEFWIEF